MGIPMKTLILLVLVTTSCSVSKTRLNSEEYLSWYASDQNTFAATVNEQNVDFTIQLIPIEADASRLISTKEMTPQEAKKELDNYANQTFFKLSIQLPNQGLDIYNFNETSQVKISDRMRYFSFDFKKDIALITKQGDTMQCTNLLHERGISGSTISTFLIDFNGVSINEISTLIIEEKALVEKSIQLDLSHWNTRKLPKLTF